MASSYSTNLKIELQATGENSGTWGTITNTNLGTALEQAVVGYGNPSYPSDANLTLTYTDTNAAQAARALVLNVTSAVSLTVTRELVVPTIQKQYIVQNNTTGSQSITVKTSGGTGITVTNGRKAHLYVNGTDVIFMDDFVDINGGAIDGTTIGASSASTGAFSTLSATGNVNFDGGTFTFNDSGADKDFRVEGDTDANLLFSDASTDRIGVGTSTPATKLDVNGTITATAANVATVNVTTLDATNIEVTNIKAKDGTAAGSIADSTGVVTLASSVLTTTDINGGTIDGTTIGGSSAAAGTFTTLTASSIATFAAGSAAAPSITTTGDTNTGLFFPAADTIGFSEGGVEAARFDSSGNFGIGTTSPAERLQVTGNARILNSGADTEIQAFGPNGFASFVRWGEIGAADRAVLGFAASSGTLQYRYGGTSMSTGTLGFAMDTSGNLGLGVTPSAGAASTNASPQLQLGSAMTLFGFSTSTNRQANIACNAYYDNANNFKYINTDAATVYRQLTGSHVWYNAASGTAGNTISFTQAMALDASGTLNIKTGAITGDDNATLTASAIGTNGTVAKINSAGTGGTIRFDTNGSERARITSAGLVGIGTTSPATRLHISQSNSGDYASVILLSNAADTAADRTGIYGSSAPGGASPYRGGITFWPGASGIMTFHTGNNASPELGERCRIDSSGNLMVGTTNANPAGANVTGHSLLAGGLAEHSNDANVVVIVNRKTDDGELIRFLQAGASEGSISVSGATVSYNAFAGSHWSQLQDGSKPDILRGTVMESINELCVWPDEQNERLPKSKVSDTAGSKKVYGVFMAWDNDWATTNDMYVTAVGAFICRVNASVTVQEGDLLESNGDGTARVQADDIIRSSTIGKVTSTVKTHQYADGSYCVPTVLYCG